MIKKINISNINNLNMKGNYNMNKAYSHEVQPDSFKGSMDPKKMEEIENVANFFSAISFNKICSKIIDNNSYCSQLDYISILLAKEDEKLPFKTYVGIYDEFEDEVVEFEFNKNQTKEIFKKLMQKACSNEPDKKDEIIDTYNKVIDKIEQG